MYVNSITSKGQITLPKEFRQKLGLDTLRRAQIRLNDRNEIVITPEPTMKELRASIARPGQSDDLLSNGDRERGAELARKYGLR